MMGGSSLSRKGRRVECRGSRESSSARVDGKRLREEGFLFFFSLVPSEFEFKVLSCIRINIK
jgi:hypothetical protein